MSGEYPLVSIPVSAHMPAQRTSSAARVEEIASSLLMLDQAGSVLRAFQLASIPAMAIKGLAYLASFRPPGSGRRLRDFDLLIHPEDHDRADRVLQENGFAASSASSDPVQQLVPHQSYE